MSRTDLMPQGATTHRAAPRDLVNGILTNANLHHAELWYAQFDRHTDLLHIQERAMASVSSGITIADVSQPDCPLVYCNEAFTTITGYTPDEVLGLNCRFLQGPDTDPGAVQTLREAVKAGRACTVVFKNYRKDKTPFWNELTITPVHDDSGTLTHFIGVQHDISARQEAEDKLLEAKTALEHLNQELETRIQERTHELERANAQLRHDAFHDGLTGLANRSLFYDRLSHALERANRGDRHGFAVLFLSLDRFKVVNEAYGHSTGDVLLMATAERLRRCVRPADTVARWGGDTFAMLLEGTGNPEEAVQIAERIQHAFERPFDLNPRLERVSVSIGIVVSSADYSSEEDVMRDADIALDRAKTQGRARHALFDLTMRDCIEKRLSLEADLHRAIDKHELEVHYQPIFRASDQKLVSFEALVRWQHPVHGRVSPAEFIPIAEDTGLVVALDRWVLKAACRQLASWQEDFPTQTLHLNINLSSQQFTRSDLVAYVKDTLFETAVAPEQLRLELTEAVMMTHSAVVQANLEALSALGVELHIDDFGTGYSSLSYLQTLPSDTLKIDRSFTDRMLASCESDELVKSIIQMAHNLNMSVVAERVENEAQHARLVTYGCDYVQGYHFARPMAAAQIGDFLNRAACTA